MELAKDLFNYLVGIGLHPGAILIVLLILIVFKQRWEVPLIEKAKEYTKKAIEKVGDEAVKYSVLQEEYSARADKVSNIGFGIAAMASLLGEFAFYPIDFKNSIRHQVIQNIFMSIFATFASAFSYWFIDRFGILDLAGRWIQKKAEDKMVAP